MGKTSPIRDNPNVRPIGKGQHEKAGHVGGKLLDDMEKGHRRKYGC